MDLLAAPRARAGGRDPRGRDRRASSTGYLAYLETLGSLDVEVAADFLVMAATLMSIKARSLLPTEEVDLEAELDPRDELIQRLIEYRRFKGAAGDLDERFVRARGQIVRHGFKPLTKEEPDARPGRALQVGPAQHLLAPDARDARRPRHAHRVRRAPDALLRRPPGRVGQAARDDHAARGARERRPGSPLEGDADRHLLCAARADEARGRDRPPGRPPGRGHDRPQARAPRRHRRDRAPPRASTTRTPAARRRHQKRPATPPASEEGGRPAPPVPDSPTPDLRSRRGQQGHEGHHEPGPRRHRQHLGEHRAPERAPRARRLLGRVVRSLPRHVALRGQAGGGAQRQAQGGQAQHAGQQRGARALRDRLDPDLPADQERRGQEADRRLRSPTRSSSSSSAASL